MPTRLFPSARRNCSREAEDEQQIKVDGEVEAGAGLQIQLNRTGLIQLDGQLNYKSGWTVGKSAAAESACRQYRVVRKVLLPEAELRLRQQGGLQIWLDRQKLNCKSD